MELGARIDLYEHALQSATRATRDGASDEIVACALLHDVGEVLCPSNHGDVAAAILRPYISKEAHWVLAHHEVFQVSANALACQLAQYYARLLLHPVLRYLTYIASPTHTARAAFRATTTSTTLA